MLPDAQSASDRESIAHIDELVRRIEALPDPFARALAVDLVQAVMTLHASALRRILQILGSTSNEGLVLEAMTGDDLVSSVLALHQLHPDDCNTRVRRAVDRLRRFFDSRGVAITLLELSSELVRVRLTAQRPGAGSAAKQIIEDAISEAAPEIGMLLIEGIEEKRDPGFIPLSDLIAAQPL